MTYLTYPLWQRLILGNFSWAVNLGLMLRDIFLDKALKVGVYSL